MEYVGFPHWESQSWFGVDAYYWDHHCLHSFKKHLEDKFVAVRCCIVKDQIITKISLRHI